MVVPLVAGDRGADDSTTNTSSSSSTTAGLGGSTACLTTQQNMPGYTPLPQASCITLVFVLCVIECLEFVVLLLMLNNDRWTAVQKLVPFYRYSTISLQYQIPLFSTKALVSQQHDCRFIFYSTSFNIHMDVRMLVLSMKYITTFYSSLQTYWRSQYMYKPYYSNIMGSKSTITLLHVLRKFFLQLLIFKTVHVSVLGKYKCNKQCCAN